VSTAILTTLPNGLRIALQPMPSTYSASLVILVGVGSRYEEEAEAGASHFLEHMLFKGTTRRPNAQIIADALERVGGRFNASTSRETTTYYTKVPYMHSALGLDVLADMLRCSLLDPVEVEREKGVILEELAQGEDVPTTVGAHLLQKTVWGDHPLGRPIIGSRETIGAVDAAALRGYRDNAYVPEHMVVSVAGNIDPEDVVRQVETLFGDLPAAAGRAAPPAAYPTDATPMALARRDGQAHLYLSGRGVPVDHPDQMALAIMGDILGGGMTSRLFREVRERRGLAYAVAASASSMADHGSLGVHAGVAPAKAVDALGVIMDEIEKLGTVVIEDDEIERVRGHYEGSMLLALEDSYAVASRNGRSVLQRGYIRTPEESLALVEKVTKDDVRRVAATVVRSGALRLSVVGPFDSSDEFAPVLARFGHDEGAVSAAR